MKMTLEQYILNPMGKKNAVLNATAREAIRSDCMKRYAQVMMREHSNIKFYLYQDSKHNKYVGHFRIPSETVNKFYYDVVLEFTADENVEESGTNLFKYNCRFFSNDPAFVYTYANVFNNDDLFITQLKPKMSKIALKQKPEEKNPSNVVGYVKTIYFAYLFMKARNMNNTVNFGSTASKLVYKDLLMNIEDADDKIKKRQEEGNRQSKIKARENLRKKQKEEHHKQMESSNIKTKMNSVGVIKPKAKIKGSKSNRKS